MPGCIRTSVEGVAERDKMLAVADATGSKLMPLISQFCESCGQHHAIELRGKSVDESYGSAPVAVFLTPEEEKAESHYQRNEYCSTCSSYHKAGNCRGSRSFASILAISIVGLSLSLSACGVSKAQHKADMAGMQAAIDTLHKDMHQDDATLKESIEILAKATAEAIDVVKAFVADYASFKKYHEKRWPAKKAKVKP